MNKSKIKSKVKTTKWERDIWEFMLVHFIIGGCMCKKYTL